MRGNSILHFLKN